MAKYQIFEVTGNTPSGYKYLHEEFEDFNTFMDEVAMLVHHGWTIIKSFYYNEYPSVTCDTYITCVAAPMQLVEQ